MGCHIINDANNLAKYMSDLLDRNPLLYAAVLHHQHFQHSILLRSNAS
jgi:hypothetical protein